MTDYAHTRQAKENRAQKAERIAEAAWSLGFMPYELTPASFPVIARRRREVLVELGARASGETWDLAIEILERRVFAVEGVLLCKVCDWAVLAVETEGGKTITLDPVPRDDGSVSLTAHVDGRVLGHVHAGGDPDRPLDVPMYRQHTRSCPETSEARRLVVPRCEVCGTPLWAPLAALDPSYTTHPTCDPTR